MSVIDAMRASLAALEPTSIEIIDDSAKHAGHAGAKSGGGHYRLKHSLAPFRRAQDNGKTPLGV